MDFSSRLLFRTYSLDALLVGFVGIELGRKEGLVDGDVVGLTEGGVDGIFVGLTEGMDVGPREGIIEGM